MVGTAGQISARIGAACQAAGVSQRDLAKRTGISQATLSRIVSGERAAKMNEVIAISWAVGATVAELTGQSRLRDRVLCAARATDDADMAGMREELMHYLELDEYLAGQGIPEPT